MAPMHLPQSRGKMDDNNDAEMTGFDSDSDSASDDQPRVLLSQQSTATEIFGQPFVMGNAMVEQTQPPHPPKAKSATL